MDFKGNAPKLISVAITLGVILLLVFSGVTSAFQVGLTGFSVSDVVKGGTTSTTATITIATNDIVVMDTLTLSLTGPEDRTCVFNRDGSPVSGCDGITISSPIDTTFPTTGYGYGEGVPYNYGYHSGITNGVLTYTITLDTTNFAAGIYSAKISAVLGSHSYESSSQALTVAESITTTAYAGDNANISASGMTIEMNSAGAGDVTITYYGNSNPEDSTAGVVGLLALGEFFEIDADAAITSVMGITEIRVSYDPAALNGIDESTLRLYFWDGDSWELPLEGGVNSVSHYVWARTDHFSVWGVFGSAVASVVETHGGRIGGTIVPVHSAAKNTGKNYSPFPPAGETPAAAPTGTEGAPAGITGAVIGALTSTAGMVIIAIVIVGLGVSFAALRMRKAGKKRGKAEKEED